MNIAKFVHIGVILLILSISCAEKNPPRDEIPRIKDVMAKLELAIKAENAAAIDSLIIADSYAKGYSSSSILSIVYSSPGETKFYSFGKREFFYTKDKAIVDCSILADSTSQGRPLEITLTKAGDGWLIERFDLK